MTRQNISTGTSANDGTGDTLRTAGTKINANFTELYTFLGGSANTLSTQISLEDSSVVFEGATANGFETRLMAEDATADRLVRIPNADGTLIMDTLSQVITNKTVSFASAEISSAGNASTSATHIICNKPSSGALAVGLQGGSNAGEFKIFTNKGTPNAIITPSPFAGGTSFTIAPNQGAMCVWDGSKWFLIGNQSTVTVNP